MTKHQIKLLAVGICICRIATLGIFRESTVNSSFSVETGDAWTAFENGDELLYPNTWISGGRIKRLGVPFVLYNASAAPPYSVEFCFTANAEPALSSLTITSLSVAYDNGRSSQLAIQDATVTKSFQLDTRAVDRGNLPYLRASIAFADGMRFHDSCRREIEGYMTGNNGQTTPYETRVRLRPISEVYYYPGRLALVHLSF